MLVAVDDVQNLAPDKGQHLAHCRLACAGLPNKQRGLAVLQAPAAHTCCSRTDCSAKLLNGEYCPYQAYCAA